MASQMYLYGNKLFVTIMIRLKNLNENNFLHIVDRYNY